jgi:hypothetical protein
MIEMMLNGLGSQKKLIANKNNTVTNATATSGLSPGRRSPLIDNLGVISRGIAKRENF